MAKTKSKQSAREPHLATHCIHAGVRPEPTTGAIMTPIFMTSTYVQESPGVHKGFEYARTQNPTRHTLQEAVAVLEGGSHGIAFSSGCAATTTLLHLLKSGDHVVAMDDMYGGTFRIFSKVFANKGIEFTYADLTNPKELSKAMTKKTKLVWIETPTNPMLKISDIAALTKIAHAGKAIVVVDNTFMSPIFQRPLEMGADLVVHSATKYLNGHSDVILGVVATKDKALAEQLYFLQNALGAVPSPMDCFLVLRGLKTLHLRMKAQEKNAMAVAQFLESQSKVDRVIYPGLKSHPQHDLAAKQMQGFGGMITLFLKSDLKGARRFLENVRIFALAESLGGIESLIEHPAIMTHASVPKETRQQLGIHDNMVRLSVGGEDLDDLKDDLAHALNQI